MVATLYGSSVAILRLAAEQGVTDVILTPHYIENHRGYYTNEQVKERFDILKQEIKKENIQINIYLGNEIYVEDMTVIEKLKQGLVYSLNNSKYILIEFPMDKEVEYAEDIIYEIKRLGFTPIIAHPERCSLFQNNKKLIEECIEEGALVQINVGSILGRFGRTAKKIAIKHIKAKNVHFVSTDTHSLRREEYTRLEILDKELQKLVGIYEKNKLLVYNARNVLINNDIEE